MFQRKKSIWLLKTHFLSSFFFSSSSLQKVLENNNMVKKSWISSTSDSTCPLNLVMIHVLNYFEGSNKEHAFISSYHWQHSLPREEYCSYYCDVNKEQLSSFFVGDNKHSRKKLWMKENLVLLKVEWQRHPGPVSLKQCRDQRHDAQAIKFYWRRKEEKRPLNHPRNSFLEKPSNTYIHLIMSWKFFLSCYLFVETGSAEIASKPKN